MGLGRTMDSERTQRLNNSASGNDLRYDRNNDLRSIRSGSRQTWLLFPAKDSVHPTVEMGRTTDLISCDGRGVMRTCRKSKLKGRLVLRYMAVADPFGLVLKVNGMNNLRALKKKETSSSSGIMVSFSALPTIVYELFKASDPTQFDHPSSIYKLKKKKVMSKVPLP
ncbi:hypothetical protein BHE74_00038418 [Ensete ventricosum]|nr:hypothetical protein BHE74_00038418 [Ensete ventricosum]